MRNFYAEDLFKTSSGGLGKQKTFSGYIFPYPLINNFQKVYVTLSKKKSNKKYQQRLENNFEDIILKKHFTP